MALATLSMTMLLTLLNYGASTVFQAELKTTVAISNFLGLLSGAANLVILPFQLLVLSRLIGRLGLGNASLIFPLTSLAAAGGLAVAPGLGTAAFAYLDRTALRTAFRIPTDNLLYNAVPARVKARTRAFVGGLVVPVGTIVGGLLLLTPVMRTSWFLPAAMLTLALALTVAAFRVRRHYGPALVDLLAQEDYVSLALQAPSPLEPSPFAAADPATLAHLVQKFHASTTPERAIFMAQLITAVGGEAAVPIVAQAVQAAHDGRLRASLVDVLVAAGLRQGGVRELYSGLLGDADDRVRLAAIGGLEQIDGPRDGRYLEIAARLLADPQIEVRLRVLPALVAADHPAWRHAGMSELRALLDAADPRTRARALGVVESTGATAFWPEVVRALRDGSDEVRLAAAQAVETAVVGTLSTTDREALLATFLGLRHDPIERVRVATITVLGSFGQGRGPHAAAVLAQLVEGLADASPAVRARAVEALVRAGQRAIPATRTLLDVPDSQRRRMAAVVLARIEPRRYASLVRGPIFNESLLAIYQNLICRQALADRPGPTLAMLGCALRERHAALLDQIVDLLSALHEPAAVRTIAHGLASPQPVMRANAVEALESLTTPQTAALVGPLFEPDLPADLLQSLAKRTWEVSIPTPADALRRLLSEANEVWLRTLAAAALWELSAAGSALSEAEAAELLSLAQADADANVRAEVNAATVRMAAGNGSPREYAPLSTVRRITLLKEVPFCQGMTVEQLRILAAVCEEAFFPAGTRLFSENDPGGVLYVVVWGRVGIEQEKRQGSLARLTTVEARAFLGEADFFDGHPHTHAAIALQDTLTLCLRHEPLITLARQYPDLSLELINVLGERLRAASDRVAELTRTHPRALHRLFDQLT
jgi:CRP-like cAMP-binding protein